MPSLLVLSSSPVSSGRHGFRRPVPSLVHRSISNLICAIKENRGSRGKHALLLSPGGRDCLRLRPLSWPTFLVPPLWWSEEFFLYKAFPLFCQKPRHNFFLHQRGPINFLVLQCRESSTNTTSRRRCQHADLHPVPAAALTPAGDALQFVLCIPLPRFPSR